MILNGNWDNYQHRNDKNKMKRKKLNEWWEIHVDELKEQFD